MTNIMRGTRNIHMEMRNAYKIFTDKPPGERPLSSLETGWEDNIKVDVTEICGLRFLNTFINIQIPYKQ
jgi:hypothetical protein